MPILVEKIKTVAIKPNKPKAFEKTPVMYLELLENKDNVKPEELNKEFDPAKLDTIPEESRSESEKEEFSDSEHENSNRSSDSEKEQKQSDSDRNSEANSEDIIEKSSEKSSEHNSERSSEPEKSSEPDNMSIASDKSSAKKIISSRLRELLAEDKPMIQEKRTVQNNAPTLSDLAKNGKYTIKKDIADVNGFENNMEKDNAKRQLLFKFDLLRKSYRDAQIDEFTMDSDYETMKNSYEMSVKTLSLDSSVQEYKQYLLYAFAIIEFVLGSYFKLDMKGYTSHQAAQMNSYTKLLIELGEKSYVPTGSKWPVEVRLLFLVVMNTAIFLVFKAMMKNSGENLFNIFKTTTNSNPTQKKRKMKGPDLNLDDLDDI